MSRAEEGDPGPGGLAAAGQRAQEEDDGDGLWLHGWGGGQSGEQSSVLTEVSVNAVVLTSGSVPDRV